ncbi:ATP-binding protein [Actinopolymorpha pittospori]|uniref:histidine kinase n=1 Tax=Actinopolymorpha pittospori TaxID=648752 RepID=A0A927MS07_9ACTN|nr:signal transduction histidine kinase [Actinopolymorpha pittospori]
MPATDRPRLRTRLALLYATAAVILGALLLAVVGLGAWSGRSTHEVGTTVGAVPANNTGTVLISVVVGLIVVALAAGPIGWAFAGRAVRPLRELTTAAEDAAADRLPGHGELGRYQEFADLSATLTGLYARLNAAYAAQRRFVADASHELRTPLTVQRALIQVALADPDADARSLRAVCEELLRIGDQQERLVAALLALAQGEQRPVATEPVDLAVLASEALTTRGSAAAEHDLTIRTNIQRAVVARADPMLLASLIGNLLDNAIRYNIDGGGIDIATRQVGPRAVLTISNTGPIVPTDAVDRILQPFQRLTALRTQNESTGLGLAIVRAIAGSHQADLHVLPNPDGGLTVRVTFATA